MPAALTVKGGFRTTRGRRAGQLRQRQTIVVDPNSSVMDVRQATYNVFRLALGQEQAEGDLAQPTFIVDGRYNANPLDVRRRIEAVDFGGTAVEEVVQFAYEQIISRSPVLTGRYISSHIIMQNGRIVSNPAELKLENMDDRIEIANSQPYAKKIEQGLSNQAPKGVYRLAAVRTQNVYRRIVRVKFTYRPISRLGDILRAPQPRWIEKPVLRKIGRRGEKLAKPVAVTHVYPVLMIWAQAENRRGGRSVRKSHADRRYTHGGVTRLPPYRRKGSIPQ